MISSGSKVNCQDVNFDYAGNVQMMLGLPICVFCAAPAMLWWRSCQAILHQLCSVFSKQTRDNCPLPWTWSIQDLAEILLSHTSCHLYVMSLNVFHALRDEYGWTGLKRVVFANLWHFFSCVASPTSNQTTRLWPHWGAVTRVMLARKPSMIQYGRA